jgi:hypothetical protein
MYSVFSDGNAGEPLTGGETYHIGKAWCLGDMSEDPVTPGDNSPLDGTGFDCSGASVDNKTQTDGITSNIQFYAVQSRNNDDFVCTPDVFGDDNGGGDIQANGPSDGWNGPGDLIWQAEGRFGNNDTGNPLSGDWEVGVGNNTQSSTQSDNTQNDWESGTAVPFSVDYDGTSATFTVNGNSVPYTVGSVTNTADLNIIAGKVSAGAGDNVELTSLELNSTPISPSSLTDTDDSDASYLVIGSEDLSGGFTLTGRVEFNWSSGDTAGSRPAFQVQVRD